MQISVNINEYLKANQIKPSVHRSRIYRYLLEKKNHPTVDTVFKELVREIPTLSKTTVYNTLKLFVERNITGIVSIEGNELRYDADVSTHGHFKCTRCGEVYDFQFDNNLNISDIEDFQTEKTHLYISGICRTCLQ